MSLTICVTECNSFSLKIPCDIFCLLIEEEEVANFFLWKIIWYYFVQRDWWVLEEKGSFFSTVKFSDWKKKWVLSKAQVMVKVDSEAYARKLGSRVKWREEVQGYRSLKENRSSKLNRWPKPFQNQKINDSCYLILICLGFVLHALIWL